MRAFQLDNEVLVNELGFSRSGGLYSLLLIPLWAHTGWAKGSKEVIFHVEFRRIDFSVVILWHAPVIIFVF